MENLKKFLDPTELEHIHAPPRGRESQPTEPVSDHDFHILESSSTDRAKEWQELSEGATALQPVKLKTGASKKGVYKAPTGHVYLVKAYHEPMPREVTNYDSGGWAEMATQAIFRAGNVGHLCQKSTVAMHGTKPVIVTRFEPHTSHYEPPQDPANTPKLSVDAAKIGMVDYLTSNVDRNSANFLTRKDSNTGTPLGLCAIDHAGNFQYTMPNIFGVQDFEGDHDHLQEYLRGDSDFNAFARLRAWESPYLDGAVSWWTERGPFIRHEMRKQLTAITAPNIRDHIRTNFNIRADSLDKLASEWPNGKDSGRFSHGGNLGNIVNAPLHRFVKVL